MSPRCVPKWSNISYACPLVHSLLYTVSERFHIQTAVVLTREEEARLEAVRGVPLRSMVPAAEAHTPKVSSDP